MPYFCFNVSPQFYQMKKLFALALALLTFPLFSQEINIQKIDNQVDSLLQARKIEGLQLIIVSSDRILWEGNYGNHPKKESPVEQSTLYLLNALTESFTALCILNLVNEQKFSLDDQLKDIAPEISFSNKWEAKHPIKVRHLISHTTGWLKGHFFHFLLDREQQSLKDILINYPDSRVAQYPPGQLYSHTNDGPAVAGYLIEKFSGMAFEDYVKKTILKPAGMKYSTFDHRASNLAIQKDSPPIYPRFTENPSDGLISNARDMGRFLRLLLNDGRLDSVQIFEPSLIQALKASKNTLLDQALGEAQDGYGLYRMQHGVYDVLDAKGSDIQFTAQLALIPQQDIAFFFAISGQEADRFALRDLLLKSLLPSPNTEASFKPFQNEAWLGFYKPIGYSYKFLRFLENLLSYKKIEKRGDAFFFVDMLGGEGQRLVTDDQGINRLLYNDFSIKHIQTTDALGRRVLLNQFGESYQKVSSQQAWGMVLLSFFCLLGLVSVPLVILIRFFLKYLFKKELKMLTSLRYYFLAFLSLISIGLTTLISVDSASIMGQIEALKQLASISAYSISLFTLSSLFGIFGVIGIIFTFKSLKRIKSKLMKAYIIYLGIVFFLMITYLAYFGMIGFRGWTV